MSETAVALPAPDAPAGLVPVIREGRVEDLAYIRPCWIEDFWRALHRGEGSDPLRAREAWAHLSRPVYDCLHSRTITALLERCRLRVAVDPESDVTIWGWAVTEAQPKPIVHYVYVKSHVRRQGIAHLLLDHMPRGFAFTHWTPSACEYLMRRKGKVPVTDTVNPYRGTLRLPNPEGIPVYAPHLLPCPSLE